MRKTSQCICLIVVLILLATSCTASSIMDQMLHRFVKKRDVGFGGDPSTSGGGGGRGSGSDVGGSNSGGVNRGGGGGGVVGPDAGVGGRHGK